MPFGRGVSSPFSVAASTRAAAGTTPTAPEVRLRQMRQRVHVVELAVFDAEEVAVGRAAAAVGVARAERAEHLDRADGLVDDEPTVGDVHAARDTDVTAVGRGPVSGMRTAFGTVA